MSEDLPPNLEVLEAQEPVTLGGARQMVTDLVQLIEAKALAQRLAFKTLIQELSAVAGSGAALRIQARLDAQRWDPAMLGEGDNLLREAVAQELSQLIETLDELVSGD